MMTTLTIQVHPRRQGVHGFFDSLRRDRVDVAVRQARGVSVKQLTYHSHGRRVRLERIAGEAGAERGRLLCDEKLAFPQGSGFGRFTSQSFSARLCGNFFLAVLREAGESRLRVGLYDPAAAATDVMLGALGCCADVKVVTRQGGRYALAARRALEELGAGVIVTPHAEELHDRDFVLAPTAICEPLPLKGACVTLTVGTPSAPVGGTVYGSYRFRMPNGFAELKPAELSEEYFCSALYSLGGQYELGSIIPLTCANAACAQTVASLAAYFSSR